jgi:hypothetical protein
VTLTDNLDAAKDVPSTFLAPLALVVASLKDVSAALRRADLAHCLNGDATRDTAKRIETLFG